MSSSANGAAKRPSHVTLDGTNRSTSPAAAVRHHRPGGGDIRKLYGELGVFTYDPGYGATAACDSKITYIDGDVGVLLHRGYPIEQLAEKSDFLEVAYLLLNGELPNAGAADEFEHGVIATPCCTSSCAASSTASAAMRTRWR